MSSNATQEEILVPEEIRQQRNPKNPRTKVPGDRKPSSSESDPSPDTMYVGGHIVRPSHYQSSDGKFQVWDIIDQFQLNYYFGDAVKYICRAGKKKRALKVQDIKKAVQYLQRWLDNQEIK